MLERGRTRSVVQLSPVLLRGSCCLRADEFFCLFCRRAQCVSASHVPDARRSWNGRDGDRATRAAAPRRARMSTRVHPNMATNADGAQTAHYARSCARRGTACAPAFAHPILGVLGQPPLPSNAERRRNGEFRGAKQNVVTHLAIIDGGLGRVGPIVRHGGLRCRRPGSGACNTLKDLHCLGRIARERSALRLGVGGSPLCGRRRLSGQGLDALRASFKNARALRLRFSQSLARRRQRLSHAIVRSTIQRLGSCTNPLACADRSQRFPCSDPSA